MKQYYEGKIGPQTQTQPQAVQVHRDIGHDAGPGVIIIRKPEEAFGARVRDRASDDVTSMSEKEPPPTMYIPRSPPSARAQERLVTALEYDQDRTIASSVREYVPSRCGFPVSGLIDVSSCRSWI